MDKETKMDMLFQISKSGYIMDLATDTGEPEEYKFDVDNIGECITFEELYDVLIGQQNEPKYIYMNLIRFIGEMI